MELHGAPSNAWLVEQWAAKLADVVQSMIEVRPQTECAPESVEPEQLGGPSLFWQELPLSIAPEAGFLIAAPEETWLKIGEAALRAIGLEEIAPADARSTYLEIITQATSSVAQAIGKTMGREITVLAGRDRTSEPAGVRFSRVLVSVGELERLPVLFAATKALEAALVQPPAPQAEGGPGSEQQAVVAASGLEALQSRPGAPVVNARTLDLLMEVELPVSVSFGRARLPLREVLKLTSGCIVELNRTVTEPVELIINGAVIARGEVVVVEGNYGVKIDQIISRQERLRTLK